MGLYHLYAAEDYLDQGPIFRSCICFFFASWTRANGTFNLLFIGYRFLHIFVKLLVDNNYKVLKTIKNAFSYVVLGLFAVICIVTPFFIHMFYLYSIYCVEMAENTSNYTKPGYCSEGFWKGYAYMQKRHFGVVPLIWNELYNFFPNYRVFPIIALYIIFMYKLLSNQAADIFLLGIPSVIDEQKVESFKPVNNFMRSPRLVPFFWISLINWITLVFNSHIVVSTRILCQNPLLYWYAAFKLTSGKPSEKGITPPFSLSRHWILLYFMTRFITGPIIFGGNSAWF